MQKLRPEAYKKLKSDCAVPFCKENIDLQYKFPINEKIGITWMNSIGNKDIIRIFEKEGYKSVYKENY